MGKFVINGGTPLFGRVRVSGSKNSALPLIFASLTVRGISRIYGIPDIGDVRVALDIIRAYGASVSREGDLTVIDATKVKYAAPPREAVRLLRASTYLMGASLVRFGHGEISEVGGCNFSSRPIDMHLDAIRAFGGVISDTRLSLASPHPAHITFNKRSVGATVNALILASGIERESIIEGAAVEPHIMDLVDFLRSGGARIEERDGTFRVWGARIKHAEVTVRGDMIEAGTYIAAAAVCGGMVTVSGVDQTELSPVTDLLSASGVECRKNALGITVYGAPVRKISVIAEPYPGFPTDLQPIMATVLAHAGGSITDTVWRDRLGYLSELRKFGVASRHSDSGAEIFPSELRCAMALAPDLRGGMALVIAALGAEGESTIDSAETVLRGYDDPVGKLSLLGAEIKYVK